MQLKEYSKEWLQDLCSNSYSYAEVLTKAGRQACGGNYETLKKNIKKYNIDVSHFTGKQWRKSPNQENHNSQKHLKYTFEDVFQKNSCLTQKVLRTYVQRFNAIPYKCTVCGCDGHWQNGIICLELDHIDGDNTNNEISNLRYLCPNCHALTPTYRGKNAWKHNN